MFFRKKKWGGGLRVVRRVSGERKETFAVESKERGSGLISGVFSLWCSVGFFETRADAYCYAEDLHRERMAGRAKSAVIMR